MSEETNKQRKKKKNASMKLEEKDRVENDVLEPAAVTTLGHKPSDPDLYAPHQVVWFRKVARKDMKFYVFYVLAFVGFILYCPPSPQGHGGKDGRLISKEARVVLTAVCALVAWFTLFVDIYHGTPAQPGDRKWHLLLDGHSGHFSYLTINILTTWAVYWPFSAAAELFWLYSESELVLKAVTATYAFAVFSSTLGTLLTLLFLKFNWYDKSWRRETLDMYDRRGNKMFRRKILFTHLNQMPIAFFDVVVLKQNHHILEWATPALSTVLIACFTYSLAYLAFTHFNYRTNGGVYPYTFMDEILKTWKSEITFFVALSLFCFVVCVFYYFVAVEADYIEEAVWKRIKMLLTK